MDTILVILDQTFLRSIAITTRTSERKDHTVFLDNSDANIYDLNVVFKCRLTDLEQLPRNSGKLSCVANVSQLLAR